MNKTKILIVTIVSFSFITGLFSDDISVAKFNLEKAYNHYKNGMTDLSRQYLEISSEFSRKFPEYYYLSDLLMDSSRKNALNKKENCRSIIEYLDNSFLASKYEMLIHAESVFESVREYDQCALIFDRILSLPDTIIKKTYIDYIGMLLKDKNNFKRLPEVIKKAEENFADLDFKYFQALYEISSGGETSKDFIAQLSVLESNNYSKTRTLFLKVLFYNDAPSILVSYNDYLDLAKNNNLEPGFKKKILFALLQKSYLLGRDRALNLLRDWNSAGQNDAKTNILLQNKYLTELIRADSRLNDSYNKYSGVRMKDDDEDGNWEQYLEYYNGNLVNFISDENQDGINEFQIKYNQSGRVLEYSFFDNADDYKKFIFNEKDQSLSSVEYFKKNRLVRKFTINPSSFFPRVADLGKLTETGILANVSFEENWEDGYKYIKYSQSKIIYVNVDRNNNGIFEEKRFYINGIIDSVEKDMDEDGISEIKNQYKNGMLKEMLYKSDKNQDFFNYKEDIIPDRIEKSWDTNNDGKFDIIEDDFNNGLIVRMIDINYDGRFDFRYEIGRNKEVRIYKITGDKFAQVADIKNTVSKKNKNWIIVTPHDTETIITPDALEISDKKMLSGTFEFKNKKYEFKNGLIKTDSFSFNIFLINDMIYLSDNR